jgi:hypothetical protein
MGVEWSWRPTTGMHHWLYNALRVIDGLQARVVRGRGGAAAQHSTVFDDFCSSLATAGAVWQQHEAAAADIAAGG